jgi:hypothetical protein
MKQRFLLFTIDIWRFTPLVAVSLAVLVNIVNLRNVLDGQLSAGTGLARFAVAFLLSLIGVGGVSRLLTTYAQQLTEKAEREEHSGPGSTTPGAGRP